MLGLLGLVLHPQDGAGAQGGQQEAWGGCRVGRPTGVSTWGRKSVMVRGLVRFAWSELFCF